MIGLQLLPTGPVACPPGHPRVPVETLNPRSTPLNHARGTLDIGRRSIAAKAVRPTPFPPCPPGVGEGT